MSDIEARYKNAYPRRDGFSSWQLAHEKPEYKQIRKIPFYQRVPEMIPFIGEEYEQGKGALLICKNYGVPNVDGEQLNECPEYWHKLSADEDVPLKRLTEFLAKSDIDTETHGNAIASGWINPRYHMTAENKGWIWHKIVDRIIPSNHKPFGTVPGGNSNEYISQNQREHIYQHLSFMNFFTRPGTLTTDIDIKKEDIEQSYKVLERVVDILRPKIIFTFGGVVDKCLGWREVFETKSTKTKVINLYSPFARGKATKEHKQIKLLPELLNKHLNGR